MTEEQEVAIFFTIINTKNIKISVATVRGFAGK